MAFLILWAVLAAIAFSGFVALGNWQVERRAWKLDLIDRVEARIHAAPTPAPDVGQWPGITRDGDEYRRVQASGTFLHDRETLVQAVTDLGSGFWVMTPLQRDDDVTVLVNRGFVDAEHRERASRQADEPIGETTVTGLLRISEPEGGFLRSNDPAADQWFSRDVAAIAAARGLAADTVAPYFVDAETPRPPAPGSREAAQWPIGGLTVVQFKNTHAIYAITWYGLALMVVAAAVFVGREERRLRRAQAATLVRNGDNDDAPFR